MSDYEPLRGLPGPLPPGEHLVWQGQPNWRVLARKAFLGDWVAIYFGLLMLWRFGEGMIEGAGLLASLGFVLWVVPVAVAALAVIALLAWASADSTVYTITTRRVAMRIGVALPMTINVPFRRVVSADLKPLPGGCGDISFALSGREKVAYLALWPHARPWHFGQPQPMMRAVPEAATVARTLAGTLAAFQAEHGTAAEDDAAPAARQAAGRLLAAE